MFGPLPFFNHSILFPEGNPMLDSLVAWHHFFNPRFSRSVQVKEADRPVRTRVLTFASLFGVVSVTVFVDSQLFAAAGALIWAVGGYFSLSVLPFAVLALAIGLPAIWGCIIVAIMAFDAETDPENN
jgi:hypothetical protein